MTCTNLIRAAAAMLLLSACGSDSKDAALDNLPDEAGLTLEAGGSGSAALSEALVSDPTALDPAATLASTPATNDDLAAARDKVAAVNQAIRTVLQHVTDVVRAEGAPAPGESRTYGPAERCVVSTACDAGGSANLRLRVYRAFGSTWAFALEAQAGADWKPVFAGWLRRATEARRGVGRVAVNLDNLAAAAPAYTGRGVLLGGFANGALVKVLHYHLVGFTPDPARWPATTAVFRGFKTAAGVTRVRVAGIENLYGAAGSDPELGFGHVAWHPTLGGRAYAIVTNFRSGGVMRGDVPRTQAGAEQYFFGRACYAPGAPTAPVYKEWFLCERGVGPRACVLAQGGTGTPVVGGANLSWSACAGLVDPPELQPPDAALATPEDTSDEPGVSATGLQPEDPPATATDVTPQQ